MAPLRARCLSHLLILACWCGLARAGHKSGATSGASSAAGGSDAVAVAATLEDLPRLGVNGMPVLTVDGRVCRFPWTGPDGVRHAGCAALQASGDDARLWCKDVNDLWGICSAGSPSSSSSSKHGSKGSGGGRAGASKGGVDGGATAAPGGGQSAVVLSAATPGPTAATDTTPVLPVASIPRGGAAPPAGAGRPIPRGAPTDGLPLMTLTPTAAAATSPNAAAAPARAAVSPAGGGVGSPAVAASTPMNMLAVPGGAAPLSLVDTSTPLTTPAAPSADAAPDAAAQMDDSQAASALAADSSAPAPAAAQDPLATTPLTMPSVRTDVKGPTQLSQAAWDAVARLRVQLASATAISAAQPDNAVAAANVRVLRAQIAGLLSGFVDPGQVAAPTSSSTGAAAPVCAAQGAQCGGLQPGSNTDLWRGPSECCGGANNGTLTCVQTDPAFAQCVPVEESRARGCSALYARCGGDFWAGPFCCATNQACVYESRAVSRCARCNDMYAQCGGMENGKPWSKPSCCASGGTCKQVNQYYYQCVKGST